MEPDTDIGRIITNKLSMPCAHGMPLIKISMYPGRTKMQKEEFAKAVTDSAVEILKAKPNHVIVVFEDNPQENWYLAGDHL